MREEGDAPAPSDWRKTDRSIAVEAVDDVMVIADAMVVGERIVAAIDTADRKEEKSKEKRADTRLNEERNADAPWLFFHHRFSKALHSKLVGRYWKLSMHSSFSVISQ